MKTIFKYIAIAICVIIPSFSFAQTYQGDITLTNQQEVDAFNYTRVTGKLYISDRNSEQKITNLNGLSELVSVGYRFTISCDELTSLDGLSSFTTANKYFEIVNNKKLTDISGLSALKYVGNHFHIISNAALETLNGFEAFKEHTTYIDISNCERLKKIKGFGALEKANMILIRNNPSLESISGFNSLQTTTSSITINTNSLLTDIHGFSNLNSVGGYIKIKNNEKLLKFCSIHHLLSNNGVADDIIITGNAQNPTKDEIIAAGACETNTNNSVIGIKNTGIKVYPNPFDDKIMIDCTDLIEVCLLNQTGNVVLSAKQNHFDTGHLPAGIYVAIVKITNRVYQNKLVKH